VLVPRAVGSGGGLAVGLASCHHVALQGSGRATKKPTRAGGFRLFPLGTVLSGNQIRNPPGAAMPPPVLAGIVSMTAVRVPNHGPIVKTAGANVKENYYV